MESILGQQAGYSVTARRNNSLSSSDRSLAYGLIALVSFSIAVAFACLGAWLILPFAGLELLVLAWAYRYMERHAGDYERLTIEDDVVQVEIADVNRVRRVRFNRWWAQVVCADDGGQLALRSHGRQIEFGRFLTKDERRTVAGVLRARLHAR
jgi:uncharacterized membrane protein